MKINDILETFEETKLNPVEAYKYATERYNWLRQQNENLSQEYFNNFHRLNDKYPGDYTYDYSFDKGNIKSRSLFDANTKRAQEKEADGYVAVYSFSGYHHLFPAVNGFFKVTSKNKNDMIILQNYTKKAMRIRVRYRDIDESLPKIRSRYMAYLRRQQTKDLK
jgi:hypothetical protein